MIADRKDNIRKRKYRVERNEKVKARLERYGG